jgi:hypothetical protein
MPLFEQLKQNILEKIKELSVKHQLNLYNKILKENDMANLKAMMTEAHFGLFFDQYCKALKYDKEAFTNSQKTPDWTIEINGQTIIVEVGRLNPAEEDQRIQDAESKAISEFQKKNPGVFIAGSYHPITQKPLKLSGETGVLATKAEKYGPLVYTDNLPLIIGLYFDFISGHDKLDLFTCLYGRSCEFGGHVAHPDFPLGTKFHDLTDAMFYNNEQIKNNVSGVLLKTDNEYIYFHNYYQSNRLNTENTKWLQSFSLDYYKF